jgi:hypothetical protein
MTDANPASILDSVKKVLGFDPDYTAFDLDITMFINAAFGKLQQLGVGGDAGFVISDRTTLWSQYVEDLVYLGMIQQYIFMNVRLVFDTPPTGFAISAFQKMIEELAFRINVAAEHINPPSDPFAPVDAGPGGGVTTTYFKVKVATIPFASSVTPDAGAANTFYLTLDDSCTINAPVNGADGESIRLELTGNGHVVTWGAGWNFGTAGPPVLSGGGKTDVISAVYRQAVADWYTGYIPGF